MSDSTTDRVPIFGGLPEEGLWTSLALTRAQFLAILALALALFVFVDGPVWEHLRASHFRRIMVSYAAIPIAVACALARNGKARPVLVIATSAVLALIKLVLTAGILVAIAIARA